MKSYALVTFSVVVALSVLMFATVNAETNEDARELSEAAAGAAAPSTADWLAYIRQQNRYHKRGRDPADPRNLFAAIYGNYASNIGWVRTRQTC